MTTVQAVRDALDEVHDPELPVITIADLGVLRDVQVDGDDVVVTVTPTFSGCPAMDEIRDRVREVLAARGWNRVQVRTVLSPPWSTADVTEAGRRALQEYGVAPPPSGPVLVPLGRPPSVACPQCGSTDTEELSRFGAAPCRSLERCRSCREPFDRFKAH